MHCSFFNDTLLDTKPSYNCITYHVYGGNNSVNAT